MWKTVGQERSIEIVSRGIRSEKLAHSYLITGIESVGKMTLALDIARASNCIDMTLESRPCGSCDQCFRIGALNHTDLFIYDLQPTEEDGNKMSTTITLEQLRDDFLKQIYRKPFEGRNRVFIIAAVERMRTEQANILLKTLEEPPDNVIILLLSKDHEGLIETIVSRCQLLRLRPVGTEIIRGYVENLVNLSDTDREEITRLSRGRIGWAYRAATDVDFLANVRDSIDAIETAVTGTLEDKFKHSRNLSSRFRRDRRIGHLDIDHMLTWWRDVLLVTSGIEEEVINISRLDTLRSMAASLNPSEVASTIKYVRSALRNLEKNVSPGLVYDNLMLKLPR